MKNDEICKKCKANSKTPLCKIKNVAEHNEKFYEYDEYNEVFVCKQLNELKDNPFYMHLNFFLFTALSLRNGFGKLDLQSVYSYISSCFDDMSDVKAIFDIIQLIDFEIQKEIDKDSKK